MLRIVNVRTIGEIGGVETFLDIPEKPLREERFTPAPQYPSLYPGGVYTQVYLPPTRVVYIQVYLPHTRVVYIQVYQGVYRVGIPPRVYLRVYIGCTMGGIYRVYHRVYHRVYTPLPCLPVCIGVYTAYHASLPTMVGIHLPTHPATYPPWVHRPTHYPS